MNLTFMLLICLHSWHIALSPAQFVNIYMALTSDCYSTNKIYTFIDNYNQLHSINLYKFA